MAAGRRSPESLAAWDGSWISPRLVVARRLRVAALVGQGQQFLPRVLADRPVRPCQRLRDALRPGDADRWSRLCAGRAAKLQCRRAGRHVVAGADRLDPADGIEHLRRSPPGRRSARTCRALGEHAAGVGRGVEHGDALADAKSIIGSALRLARVKRLWVMIASKSQSRSSGIITSTLPAARPTASTSPSSFILKSAVERAARRGDRRRASAAYSGSCRWMSWMWSRPSAARLSSSERRAWAPSKRSVCESRSSLVEMTKPCGSPPLSRMTSPMRSSLRPAP